MKCIKCDVELVEGKAIEQTYTGGALDFPSDKYPVTLSAGGSGKLVDCLKCNKCGWSITK